MTRNVWQTKMYGDQKCMQAHPKCMATSHRSPANIPVPSLSPALKKLHKHSTLRMSLGPPENLPHLIVRKNHPLLHSQPACWQHVSYIITSTCKNVGMFHTSSPQLRVAIIIILISMSIVIATAVFARMSSSCCCPGYIEHHKLDNHSIFISVVIVTVIIIISQASSPQSQDSCILDWTTFSAVGVWVMSISWVDISGCQVKKTNTVANILENRLANTAKGLQQSVAQLSLDALP